MAEVRDNAAEKRFELTRDGVTAYSTYVRAGDVLTVDHTRVPKEAEGKGMASALTRGVLDIIRGRGEKIIPVCPFTAAYMRKHSETRDLLAEPDWLEKHPPEPRKS